jgi:hypothetical protein
VLQTDATTLAEDGQGVTIVFDPLSNTEVTKVGASAYGIVPSENGAYAFLLEGTTMRRLDVLARKFDGGHGLMDAPLRASATPRGDALAVAGSHGELYVMDAAGVVRQRVPGPERIATIAFSGSGQHLFVVDGRDTTVQTFDASGLVR